MERKNYAGLLVVVDYNDEPDVLTASQALDGIFDDNRPIKDTNWLD